MRCERKIVIGGIFTNFNGTAANHLTRLNADGSRDASFDIGSGLNETVQCAVAPLDGSIVAGGLFTSVNGVSCGRIARFVGLTGSPFPAITVQPDMQGMGLFWRTYGAGWVLESTTDLDLPFHLSELTIAATNGVSYSSAPAAGGRQFFRLRRQP